MKVLNKTKNDYLLLQYLNKLITAGHSLQTSLTIIEESTPCLSKKIKKIKKTLEKGISIEGSLLKMIQNNSSFSIKTRKTPIELLSFIKHTQDWLKEKIKYQKNIQKKCQYPFILILILTSSSIMMATHIIPSYTQFFQSLNAPLPKLIKEVIKLNSPPYTHGLYILFCISFILMIYYKKPILNNIKSNIPPYIFSDFFWISALLLNNGYPAQTVFTNLSTSKKNELHIYLTKAQKKINETGDPIQGLIKLPKLSRYHIEQLKQSSKNKSLAHILKQIAKELQEETLQKIEKKINILKPLIIIISGLYILALFYLMMVPMLKSMTSILE